jgi:hypothetical protein
VWLQHQKKLAKREAKSTIIAGIEKDQLERLQFSVAETKTILEWKLSEEFSFEGNMYDIVASELKSDSVIYWCWLDKKETVLNHQLAVLLDTFLGNNKERTEKKDRLTHFAKTLFFQNSKKHESYCLEFEKNKIPFFQECTLKGYSKNGVPPPERMA